MTAIDFSRIAKPEPQRDRWGRYLIPDVAGKIIGHTRATTVAEAVDDRYNLEKWKMRQVAYGIGRRKDLYAVAASHDPETDRSTYDGLIERAMEAAKSSAAASEGTALHRFTEKLDTGQIELGDIPDQWRAQCELYRRTVADAGLQWEAVEQILVDDRYQVAGTTDRICRIGDTSRIADLKTGKNLKWSWQSIAIQLAIYANHTAVYDPVAGQRGPRIDVDTATALVIHLPAIGPEAGTCTIYEIDIAAGYNAYLTALEVRAWRKTKGLARPVTTTNSDHAPLPPAVAAWTDTAPGATSPAAPTPVERRAALAPRVARLAGQPDTLADLRRHWPAGVPQPLPAEPTDDQLAALGQVLDALEARHQLPF